MLSTLIHDSFEARGFGLLAWVYMPDHVHWLLEGRTESSDLKAAMKLARQRSAVAFRQSAEDSLWQPGFHERVLRRTDDTESVANYILNNPVRAGLAIKATDYRFSWSITIQP